MVQAIKTHAGSATSTVKRVNTPAERKLLASATPFFQPATRLNPNNIWLRRMTRIVRHLRDDLARIHKHEIMPSTWMIKCLLASVSQSEAMNQTTKLNFNDEQWDRDLRRILHRLYEHTDSASNIRGSFFELDGLTPLFPNQELFGPQHANRFAELALEYLRLNVSPAG